VCGRDSCDGQHEADWTTDASGADAPPSNHAKAGDASPAASTSLLALEDAVDVAREGQAIETNGIRYLWAGIIPAYGMVGFLVAYAKVGKTTFGHALAGHVARGLPFLGRDTTPTRVLVLAAEDPPEYVAWLARRMDTLPRGAVQFSRGPWLADARGLAQVVATVRAGGFGLVLVSSWQSVIRGLVKDENDNAGAVMVVEGVKAAARRSGVPWLVDAHSGKAEDQGDDADPLRALRGASAAAGAADYLLSLRYANGAFGTERRLAAKGRFTNLPTLRFDVNLDTGDFRVLGTAGADAARESTWRLIVETGALTTAPRTISEIARTLGWDSAAGKLGGTKRAHIAKALAGRADVLRDDAIIRGQKTTRYRLAEVVL
jgi:hypothetical protein